VVTQPSSVKEGGFMPVTTAEFRTHSEIIHHEHEALNSELREMQAALEALVCHAEVFANLASADRLYLCGRHLAHVLPEHFENEETTLLDPLAVRSPELAAFALEMKRQHAEMRDRLVEFCARLEGLEDCQDLYESIVEIKDRGMAFTRQLAAHMHVEETKFQKLAA
jgi:hypothetical protein